MVDKPLTNCSNVLTSKYQKVIYYSKLRLFLLKNKTKTLVIELTLLIKKLGAQIKKLFLNKSFALGFGLTYILLLVTTRRAVCAVVYKTLTDIEKEQTKRRTWKEYFKSLKFNFVKFTKKVNTLNLGSLSIGLAVGLASGFLSHQLLFPKSQPNKVNEITKCLVYLLKNCKFQNSECILDPELIDFNEIDPFLP